VVGRVGQRGVAQKEEQSLAERQAQEEN